jgi:O-antigen ligase
MIVKERLLLFSRYVRAPQHPLITSFAVLGFVAFGYALATSNLQIGVAVALGAVSVAIWTWPRLGLAALAIPYVLPVTVSLGGLRGRDLTAVFFGIAALAWTRTSGLSRRMMLVLALGAGLAATVLVSAIGFLHQPGETASLAEIGASLLLLAAGVALGAMTGLRPTLRAIRLVVLGVALVAAVMWVFQYGSPFAPNAFSEFRRAGTGGSLGANGLGTFLAIGAVMEITLRRSSILEVKPLLLLGLLIGVVLFSGSRGAILVLVFGLLSLTFRAGSRLLSIALAGLLVAATVWAVVTLGSVRVASVERVGANPASVENSVPLRIEAARLAVRLMIEHPLTGVGYGQAQYFATSDPQIGMVFDTHNEYLRIGAESGIPALILLLSLLGLCLWTGVRSVRRNGAGDAFGATAAVAGFAFSLLTIQGFKSFVLSAPWMLLAGALVGATEAHPAESLGARATPRRTSMDTRSWSMHPGRRQWTSSKAGGGPEARVLESADGQELRGPSHLAEPRERRRRTPW